MKVGPQSDGPTTVIFQLEAYFAQARLALNERGELADTASGFGQTLLVDA